ncbi:MAG: hypothetical protein CSA34_04750 [Desulfobulbus propionicus]|nr:MAG: hypothetical protein CSA34_04750 [Desulfobulbus propionicus]
MEGEIRDRFGKEVSVALIASSGGVFEVFKDDTLLFSKRQLGRFPEEGEICRMLAD